MADSAEQPRKPVGGHSDFPSDLPADPLLTIRGASPGVKGETYVKDKLDSLLDTSVPSDLEVDREKLTWAQQTLLVRKKKLQREEMERQRGSDSQRRPRYDLRDAETIVTNQPQAPAPDRMVDPSASVYETAPREVIRGALSPSEENSEAPILGNITPQMRLSADASFRIIGQIGEGGFGVVYEAEQVSLGRVIALKKMHERGKSAPGMVNAGENFERLLSFRQEAYATAFLEHPNIIPIYDLAADAQGTPMIAMKRVLGDSWDVRLRYDFRRLTPEDFLSAHIPVLIQVTLAVKFAHSRGIVHRDLKPSQVMLGDYGEVLLMDWGLAVSVDAEKLSDPWKPLESPMAPTIEWAMNPAGTPAFMAPEQTQRSTENIGPWTDVYLLGSCLYMLLTGLPPHSGNNAREVLKRVAGGEFTPVEEAAQGRPVPPELRLLIERAMGSPDPRQRITAAQFLDALNAYQAGVSSRGESHQLTLDIERRMNDEVLGYNEYSGLLNQLAQARTLWKGNPMVEPLLERVRTAYIQVALRNGDLTLARVEANLLSDEATRNRILQDVGTRQAALARRNQQRRLAIAGVVGLSFLSAAFGIVALQQRTEAEIKRREAETATGLAKTKENEAIAARQRAEVEQYFSGIGFTEAYLRDQRFEKALQMLIGGLPLDRRDWEWGYLMARTSGEMAVLRRGAVAAGEAQFHSVWVQNGTHLVTGGATGKLRLWNMENLEVEKEYDLGLKGAWCIAISPDGRELGVTSTDGRALLIDFPGGEIRQTLEMGPAVGPVRTMRGAVFSPDSTTFYTSGTDNHVTAWRVSDGTQLWRTPFDKPTYDLDVTSDGKLLAVACLLEGQAALLDPASGEIVRRLEGHGPSVLSVRFSPDDRRLLTSSSDFTLRVFDVATGDVTLTMTDEDAGFRHAEFDATGRFIASSSGGGLLRVWDASTGRSLASEAGPKQMEKLAFHPTDTRLITTSFDEIRLWDVKELLPARRIEVPEGLDLNTVKTRLRVASFPFDRQSIWLDHDEYWLQGDGRSLLTNGSMSLLVDSYYMLYSPQADWFVRLDQDLFPTMVRDGMDPVPLGNQKVFYMTRNASGSLIAFGMVDGSLRILDSTTLADVAQFPAPKDAGVLWTAGFSPDGTRLALGWQKGVLNVVELGSPDADGKRSVSTVWENATAHERKRPVVTVDFTADGKRLATASSDETARIWDAADGRLISTLKGHALNLINARFSPDGRRVLTTSLDQTAKLWEPESGREILTLFRLQETDDAIVGGDFTPDGRAFMIPTRRGNVHIRSTFPWTNVQLSRPDAPDYLQSLERWKRGQRLGPEAEKFPVLW